MNTHKIITTVMALQIGLNNLIELKSINFFKQNAKLLVGKTIDALTEIEVKHYDNFFNNKEDETSDVYEVYENFVKQISFVPIYDCENLLKMYEAYKKDPKSMEGITNKILR